MTNQAKVIDTTLREGEQTPGVLFTCDEKKSIVDGLVQAGVHEIELGVSSPFTQDLEELVQYCRKQYPKFRFSLWSRCLESDIKYAAGLGVGIISLSIPVSDLHLFKKLGKDRVWAANTLKKCISLAADYGLEVAVGFEDATRADQGFVLSMGRIADQAGAKRIRLADTVGIASPSNISALVSKLSAALTNAEVGIHAHNDFGMATGNAVAALENGAGWADGALLGLGERTGCTALEQLAGYLVLAWDRPDMDIKIIKEMAAFVSEITGEKIAARQPVLGENIFACETGIHLQGLFQEPATYEPYAPESVGAKRTLMIGAKSGKDAVRRQMALLGCENLSESAVEQCVLAVRSTARKLGRSLSGEELFRLCSTM